MLPPVTIPELESANLPIDADNDFLLIRQGLNDKKITAANLSGVRLETYATLNRALNATDVLLVGANNGGGTYTNYLTNVSRIGFLTGIKMWFYSDTAPIYWQIDATLTDRVLAVKGGVNAYANSGTAGTWQQTNTSLNITQIPAHTHYMDTTNGYAGLGNPSSTKIGGGQNGGSHKNYVPTFPTGGMGSTRQTSSGNDDAPNTALPVAQGHNHGSIWRPAAAVGIICEKVG